MITLKKQYVIGMVGQTVAFGLFYYSEYSSGVYKLTPAGQKGVRDIALTLSICSSVITTCGHVRLLSRGVRYLFGNKVAK